MCKATRHMLLAASNPCYEFLHLTFTLQGLRLVGRCLCSQRFAKFHPWQQGRVAGGRRICSDVIAHGQFR